MDFPHTWRDTAAGEDIQHRIQPTQNPLLMASNSIAVVIHDKRENILGTTHSFSPKIQGKRPKIQGALSKEP